MNSILEIKNLTIRFGGLTALENISLNVQKGDILSIVGPNGSGKSTLFNCISGIYHPQSGGIYFKDKNIIGLKPWRIAELGISRTFQNLELFKKMTVIDNLMLGRHLKMGYGILAGISMMFPFSPALKEEIVNRNYVHQLVDIFQLYDEQDLIVGGLPLGTQKIVEFARALALQPEIILLDEPSIGLNSFERQQLIYAIQTVQQELGTTMIIIEHNMEFISKITNEIAVLNYGHLLIRGDIQAVSTHPEVIRAYLGSDDE